MKSSITVARELDPIDDVLRVESKARAELVAIGEHWMRLQKVGFEPTNEELALRDHLVGHWRKVAHALATVLEHHH